MNRDFALQYGAGISKTIDCPKSIVGRVIGKGGETIKTLQKNFGANIQIDQQSDPMKITVAGQPHAVEAAAAAVQEIVNGGNPYLGGPGGPQGYGQGKPSTHSALWFIQCCSSQTSASTTGQLDLALASPATNLCDCILRLESVLSI